MSHLAPLSRLAPPASNLTFRAPGAPLAAWLWRLGHPRSRGPFAVPLPAPQPRTDVPGTDVGVAWTRGDGPRVLLVPPFGVRADALRAAGADAVPDVLSARGFAPGLMVGEGGWDQRWRRDLPAAVACAGGASLVGFGLGAWLAMLAAAYDGRGVHRVVAVCPPVDLQAGRGPAWMAHLLGLLPAHWRVPAAAVGPATAALTNSAPRWAPGARGDVLRGVLAWGAADPSLDLARPLLRALSQGHLCDADGSVAWMDRLADGRLPLTVLAGTADPWCRPEAARGLAMRWGGPADVVVVDGLGHLDALVAPRLARLVGERVAAALGG